MEDYLTFPLPEFLDLRLIMIWTAVTIVIFFALMFALWKNNPKHGFAASAFIAVLIGIIAIPVIYFTGPIYNDNLMKNSVEDNFNVVVTNSMERFDLLVLKDGQMLSCKVSSTDQENYYVLCDVPEGRLLLNNIESVNG